ncbi:hypothetical protein POSPLADRAFT_1157284 [Postia placenta MAD-698-R-SB12]|uniref:Borealin N-terminal domain-containing protein n=1 Tax=Postia placenta MAD-698-R-SB12 TaxID=670580 RepID=A0A1X6MLK2_9APHY|nr:hypothetical protein POSPLADRAFT_1157284 [Postia placenta MAD-698-R-SB12]OSX57311.1 hypothetical protein POSPLADRAFT_1157284 [Postia placenta MAD-698-R-SB12]
MLHSPSKRRYSTEEKKQLLANLDLEVEHRTRQIEEWLADTLENFRRHQEGLILRMPRLVREITLRDFAKYNGNVQECVKGLKREVLGTEDNAIDKGTRKRKWVASQDAFEKTEGGAVAGPSTLRDAESSRGVKSGLYMFILDDTPLTLNAARTMIATPKKRPGPSNGQGAAQRPRKLVSPSKLPHAAHASRPIRPPSSSIFNPSLPPQPRWPRRDESMLSVNGSPLANPFQMGLKGYLRTVAEDGDDFSDSDGSGSELPMLGSKSIRKKNSIIIHPSSSHPAPSLNGLHSRTNSQSSTLGLSHTSHATHSRSNSHTSTNGFMPTRNTHPPNGATAPNTTPKNPLLTLSALVSVPTKDGHVLEFDPLRTSPEELDALDGITDSAKKQAKEDMSRLIQAAVERWKIS